MHYYYPATYGGFLRASFDFPLLWFILGMLLVISYFHDKRQRATVAAYAAARRQRGADDGEWPDASVRRALFVNPGVLLAGATAIGLVGVMGWLVEFFRTDPFGRLPGYEPPPPSIAALVAATLALLVSVVLQVMALRARRAPYKPVADRVRAAIYAKPERREALFAEALALDPGVPVAYEDAP